MISVICVYNNDILLEINLLNSLKRQDVNYQLILVDNRRNKFKTLTQALNYGGKQANGDYLLFIHQDVKLHGKSWLRKAENILKSLKNIGIAGVAGIDKDNNPVGFIIDRGRYWGSKIKKSIPIFVLDEVLFIIPKKIFELFNFDEDLKWHSYSAEYCLRVQSNNLKAYVIPLSISHNSITLPILKAGNLKTDDLLLWKKHHKKFPIIFKTTDKIAPKLDRKIIKIIRSILRINKINSKLQTFQNRRIYIKTNKILDIIIPIEQLFFLKRDKMFRHSVGISDKLEYIIISKSLNVHKNYLLTSPYNLPFRKKVFNCVFLKSILEYIPKFKAEKILNDTERVSKKIVIFIPNNGYPRTKAYKNYRSIWKISEFKKRGYNIHGIKSKRYIRNSLIIFIEPIIDIIVWWVPYLAGFLIALNN
ncbi:MAG: glycosyltransferase family 2 protein [Promethearchaeota archaeon]